MNNILIKETNESLTSINKSFNNAMTSNNKTNQLLEMPISNINLNHFKSSLSFNQINNNNISELEESSLPIRKKTSFMIENSSLNNNNPNNIEILSLENYKVVATIGIGSLSKVKLVQDKYNNRVLAVKIIRCKELIDSKQIDKVRNEFEILKIIDHPFIIQLKCFNLTSSHLFFGLEYMQGGDLFSYLRLQGTFSFEETRFYIAQAICALVYLHSIGVIYRDVKPENFLLNGNGYIKLTDFSISKPCRGKTYTFCGTSEYCAPEVVLGIGHTKACDFWSLGILTYEFLVGITPFYDEDPFVVYNNITKGIYRFPKDINPNARMFIKQLLIGDARKRLGVGDFEFNKNTNTYSNAITDLVNNYFFEGFDWISLEKMTMPAFHIPKVRNNADTSHFAHFCDDSYENLLDYAFENDLN